MKPKKLWTEMTTTELREATKDLRRTMLDKTRPLNAAEQALWRKAKSTGYSDKERGTRQEQIKIRLERGLLKEADLLAKRQGLNRSELIAKALAAAIRRKAG